MAASTIRKTKRDLTLTLTDGTSVTPNTLVIPHAHGDFSADFPGPTIVRDDPLGVIDSVPALRKGADRPGTFSFTVTVPDFHDGSDELLADLFLQGKISGWVSTLDSAGNAEIDGVYHLTVDVEGTDHGDSADHSFRLDYCTFEGTMDFSGDFCTISVSGTSHAVYPSTLT